MMKTSLSHKNEDHESRFRSEPAPSLSYNPVIPSWRLPMHDYLLCLDIETIPDRSLLREDWPETKFPWPIHHRVVAISFVEARIERQENGSECYLVDDCRTGEQADWDEACWTRTGISSSATSEPCPPILPGTPSAYAASSTPILVLAPNRIAAP